LDSTGIRETKSEIRARIDELRKLQDKIVGECAGDVRMAGFPDGLVDLKWLHQDLERRIEGLEAALEAAEEDLFQSVIDSHKVLCAVKEMEEDAAYGQDPAMYYSLAVCGEAGEMANKIVKSLRNGNDPEAARRAVISELPDVIIYSAVLAHVLGIDLTRLVNDKVQVVIQRAEDGYYGGPLGGGGR